MKREQIVISFIAVAIGILVAFGTYYFYQASKEKKPQDSSIISGIKPRPTENPEESVFLSLDKPKDEEVVDTKTITIAGKTDPDIIIVISTGTTDQVVTPSVSGSFSVTETLSDGQNIIEITAIAPNGQDSTIKRTVTYTKETF